MTSAMNYNQLQNMQSQGLLYQQGYAGGGGGAGQLQPVMQYYPPPMQEIKKEKKSMFKELRNDMQAFIREHKSIIYWTLILYVVDHYCFDGALKGRLQNMIQRLVGKIETKLDQAKI